MHRLLWAFVLVAVVLGGAASGAAAQSARELFEQGVQALNAGRPADAVQAFDASYRKQPTPTALYNLALAYKTWGKPDKAVEAFEGYVKFANPKTDKATIDAVKAEIERIKAAHGRFALKLTPPDAVIDIDGARATPSNNELWVPTGQHKISISAPNYETYEQTLEVAAGRFDLEVHLREPSGPPEQRAALLVDEGMALQAGGNAQGALDKYKAANAIYPTPRGTAQMGLAEETLGDFGGAEQHINAALKSRKDPWIKENRKKLQASLRHMKRDAAQLDVQGQPIGAEVSINKYSFGTLPLPVLRVAPGSLTVRAKKDGYTDYEQVVDMPPRSKRQIVISMSEAPKPVVVPLPMVEPVAALPTPEPEPAPVVVAPLPKKEEEPRPDKLNQADYEAMSRDELAGLPGPRDPAQGFEMALNFGYSLNIGGPELQGSSGGIMPQISLGGRFPWFLSYGLIIQGSYDGSPDDAKFVVNVNPGIYVRGHIQKNRKALGFDVWGGTGIQPVSAQAAVLEPEPVDISMIDPNAASTDEGRDYLGELLAKQEAGADRVRSIQSINIPLEVGGTFYITKGLGIDLTLGFTFWLPQQSCLHDENDRICTDRDLKTQTTFHIGGGLSFLP